MVGKTRPYSDLSLGGRVFEVGQFLSLMVGKTRPYSDLSLGGRVFEVGQFLSLMVGKTRPYSLLTIRPLNDGFNYPALGFWIDAY